MEKCRAILRCNGQYSLGTQTMREPSRVRVGSFMPNIFYYYYFMWIGITRVLGTCLLLGSISTISVESGPPLHKWRLNLNNNTHTSLASHSSVNSFVLKHKCEAKTHLCKGSMSLPEKRRSAGSFPQQRPLIKFSPWPNHSTITRNACTCHLSKVCYFSKEK